MAANIALFSGPQDPSQLDASLNTLVQSLNGYIGGSVPQTTAVVNGTTSANLPAFGAVLLASTVASAAYVLSAPKVGQIVRLLTKSTLSQTVTLFSGNFWKNRTKITFKTTNVGLPQAIDLIGESTSVWGVYAASGNVKCT